MASARVRAIRAELLKIKGEVQLIQHQYKEHAEQRCEYQTKMAQLNQMVQQQTSTASQNDIMLVEDVIVVTLAAEHAAQCRYSQLPPPPDKRTNFAAASSTGTTKNAEEAIQTYQAQIDMYKEEKAYREELDAAETDMDTIYRQAVDEILDILDEYCDNANLQRAVESFAASGNACSSPRHKSRASDKQTTLSRLLGTVNPLSPRKGSSSGNTQPDVSEQTSSPTATETLLNQSVHESPKKTFDDIQQGAGVALKPPPLLDEDDAGEEKQEESVFDDEEPRKGGQKDDRDGHINDIDNSNDSKTLPEVELRSHVAGNKSKTKRSKDKAEVESSSSQDEPITEAPKKLKKKSKTKDSDSPKEAADEDTTNARANTNTNKTKKKKKDKGADADGQVSPADTSSDKAAIKTPKKKKSSKIAELKAVEREVPVKKTKDKTKDSAETSIDKKKIKKPKEDSNSEKTTKKKQHKGSTA